MTDRNTTVPVSSWADTEEGDDSTAIPKAERVGVIGEEVAAAEANGTADLAPDATAVVTQQMANVSTQETAAAAPAPGASADDVINDMARYGFGYGLEEREAEVTASMADKNSPIYSVSTFEELNIPPKLLEGIYGMKFRKPSKIQEKALPIILQLRQNIIAQSQSGTGKTAAFVLGMLAAVDVTQNYTQSICISPTRELARQNMDVVTVMSKYMDNISLLLVVKQGETRSRVNPHVVVGTPGSILQMTSRKFLDLGRVKVFVLDEADQMMDKQGMSDESLRIKKLIPRDAQCLLFSATFKPAIFDFAMKTVPRANQLRLKQKELNLKDIKQFYIDCGSADGRFDVLQEVYASLSVGQMIIFVATIATCQDLHRKMTQAGHAVSELHSKLEPEERDRIIDAFREGRAKVMISTNVAARGLDIVAVNLVINYDLPTEREGDQSGAPDMETYIHRVGRTGRFGRKGVAINFVHDARSRQNIQTIERFLGTTITEIKEEDIERVAKTLKPGAPVATA